jgi:outer membrane protein assembly factor BamB
MLVAAGTVSAEDWPMFRHDIERSAVSSEEIKLPLNPAWTHVPDAPPARAWTNPKAWNISAGANDLVSTLDYDQAHHAIVADGKLFYGASATDSVYCLDTDGNERWVYTCEGPVRLSPVYHDGKIFFGSDDGFVYCLNADDGTVVWKHLAGPTNRLIPGNGRVISEWPVRSGLIVDKGLVYFCAGIFPSHGVYMGAIDEKSGEAKWKQKIAVSPQGHLLATDDRIFVPTGRTPFQEFNRADGKNVAKLGRSTSWGKRLHGGCLAVIIDGKLVSGPSEDGQIDLFDGKNSVIRLAGLQLMVSGDKTYLLTTKGLQNVHRDKLPSTKDKRRGAPEKAIVWDSAAAGARCMAKAGGTIFVGGKNFLKAYTADGGEETWSMPLDGTVESIAISGGKVFACTDDGRIHCMAQSIKEPTATAARKAPRAAFRDSSLAKEILAATDVRKGYALVLDVEDGHTVAELAERTQLRVIGRSDDPEKVRAARAYLRARGIYGTRAVVHQGSLLELPYTHYFANIVSSEAAVPKTPRAEIRRMVRPHGGLLYLRTTDGKRVEKIKSALTDSAKAWHGDNYVYLSWKRPGLPGAGEWSHFYGDPANTACSRDTLSSKRMRLQWFGAPGPEKMVDRHNKTSSPLYKNGRMLVPGLNYFIAADAYNGTILWDMDLPDSTRIGAMRDSSNMAIGDDFMFIATRDECLKIDPQTGKELSRLSVDKFFGTEKGTWAYVATIGDTVYGSAAKAKSIIRKELTGQDKIWRRPEPLVVCSDRVFAADTGTDKLKWEYKAETGVIINPTIAIANGRVHFIESSNPDTAKVANGQVALRPLLKSAKLVALDAGTGKVIYARPIELPTITDAIYLSCSPDTVIVTGSHYRKVSAEERRGRHKPDQALRCRYDVAAFDCATGAPLWDKLMTPNRDHELKGGHGANIQHPALVGDNLFGPGFACSIRTGKEYDGWKWSVSHKCGTISTSSNYAFSRFAKEKFCYIFDLRDGASKPLSEASRPGCWINIIPAGGLILVPEASAGCTCEYSIQSSMAFLPE